MPTILLALITLSCQTPASVDSLWNKEFQTAGEIVETFNSARQNIDDNSEAAILNMCNYIWSCGEYMFSCRGGNEDIAQLPPYAEELQLDNPVVAEFMIEHGIERFTDHYFTLYWMKQGSSFQESRDGLTATVFYPIRALNENDYSKLHAVFACSNDTLHKVFLEKMKFPITNSGFSDGFAQLYPVIESNVKECEVKREVLSLFEVYENIMPGKQAPLPILKDTAGIEHTFAEYRGKILVIDVWATWCSSCLKKFPAFIELKNSYSGNDDIVFITVSIDRSNVKEQWKRVIERRGLNIMPNLFPDCEEESPFESMYHISGVPRYIVIDKEGNIVTAYAPPPGGGLEEVITNTIIE